MQINSEPIESLLASAEQYNKTTLELLKLKSVDKTADVTSTILYRAFVIISLSFFAITLTVAIALWLGELLGKTYYGLLAVAFVYGVIGIILFLRHSLIKARLHNSIITQILS